jgi:hypothetical protein
MPKPIKSSAVCALAAFGCLLLNACSKNSNDSPDGELVITGTDSAAQDALGGGGGDGGTLVGLPSPSAITVGTLYKAPLVIEG